MSIKPILFNTDMVRAIMDGRKTVTRQVIKPQPKARLSYLFAGYGSGKWSYPTKYASEIWGSDYQLPDDLTEEESGMLFTPPCHTDDTLYVRETWGISNLDYDDKVAYIVYKASENEENEGCREVKLPNDKIEKLYDSMAENSPDWRPSIHMPKESARIFLKVKNVRIERLQEIDDEQAKNEGANWKNGKNVGFEEKMRLSSVERFADIWDSTIKKSDIDRYGWDANPYVFVIEFERCEKPEGWCENEYK